MSFILLLESVTLLLSEMDWNFYPITKRLIIKLEEKEGDK
jgi:hypothetical protein